MKIGIDKIGFNTPYYYVDMNDLAVARNEDPAKYTIGLGQDEMAISPITQDPVTLAANAALGILDEKDIDKIDFVMFGTETGIDHSKAAGVYVHRLLGLHPNVRTIEMKQACYGATAALQLAKGHIALHPDSKVLILAADIARYGLNTPGEVTQGAGAVALLMSADPGIMVLEEETTYLTSEIMDFWRPIYSDTAYVDGKYSNEQYIAFFNHVWKEFQEKTNLGLKDFEAICFHLPYTKMGIKALEAVYPEGMGEDEERILNNYQISTTYSRRVGNIYTASLYLGLLSLLEQKEDLQGGARIGMYSYGSGAVGEFFSGVLQPNYRDHLHLENHEELFASRKQLTIPEYEKVFEQTLPVDGSTIELDIEEDTALLCLSVITNHQIQY